MARYALGAGLKMPPALMQSLDVFEKRHRAVTI